ncbi:hypothetical protein Ga0466249_000439 [Sporomusaceae bacterium BoRhaA]|uniref:acyltransferase family protein n=1 Tax=Pelorhabdus rhamnosifermentans TaxID=2772457 RepID=UPI001C05FE4C|nr:acyltransferase [Pelorhabdus rhamnosifermentans]MBU2699360.1 hypothetical protein [Pelorhabdus rhamnosifermentans]
MGKEMKESCIISSERQDYIDWLRILGMVVVLIFHSARFFDFIGWDLKNKEVSSGFTIFILFVNYWIMPLFFMLAGAGTVFALKTRTQTEFVRERFYRLIVPYFVGLVILVPPQRYLSALQKGQYNGEMLSFLPWYIEKKLSIAHFGFDPIWFSEIGTHLWFLAVLFIFSILVLPIIGYFKSRQGAILIKWLDAIGKRAGGIYFFILPIALVRVGLQPIFPKYSSWCDFIFWFLIFIFGFIFFSDQRFIKSAERYKYISLSIGIAFLTVLVILFSYFLEYISQCWDHPDYSWGSIVFYSMWAATTWIWLMFFIGAGKAFLNFRNTWLTYLNQATMPFYMLQQTIIIIIGFQVVQWNSGIALKYLTICGTSLFGVMGIYFLLIRRFAWLRLLFGMKKDNQGKLRESDFSY